MRSTDSTKPSRTRCCRVYVLKPLSEEQIILLVRRALADEERGLGRMRLSAADDVLQKIGLYASGDARTAYNVLEVAAQIAAELKTSAITEEIAREAMQKRVLLYDKA